MRILLTGANGFIGKNLFVRLQELKKFQVSTFGRGDAIINLPNLVQESDIVIHLAGENRPAKASDFVVGNTELTEKICAAIGGARRPIPFIVASSVQSTEDTPYGKSKRNAEIIVEKFCKDTNNPTVMYRLPGVFGKWCKPNYNSVVATFCHNIAHNLPIRIDNYDSDLRLVYIDDVIDEIINAIESLKPGFQWGVISPQYKIKLGELAEKIKAFHNSRKSLLTEKVGDGFLRALYSTYISYLSPQDFKYEVPSYSDERGVFIEMLKTPTYGQFSCFTVIPGVTRGSHYHHTKTEKFLVLQGLALMKFRNLVTGEVYEINLSSERFEIVDSIPGWVHDITNIGQEKVIVMLWANEIFDKNKPDCIPCLV